MSRNKPFAAQQPAPLYANDPGGFFAAAMAQDRVSGLASLLPSATLVQADIAVRARLLEGQIGWTPTAATWKGCNLSVSLSDAQFRLVLEEGGDTQPGRLTIVVSKAQFGGFGKGQPAYNDTFSIQAGGVWHAFVVAEMVGQHDDNEPALTLFLDKDQDELGN